MSVSKRVSITSACSSSETQMQYSDVSCHWFHFTTAILLTGSQVRWHKKDSHSFPYYCVNTMFDDALKFCCLWNWVVGYQCVNLFILLFEAVISLQGDIFPKHSVSDGSDSRACEAILMSGVAKKFLSRDSPFQGGFGGILRPQKILKIWKFSDWLTITVLSSEYLLVAKDKK